MFKFKNLGFLKDFVYLFLERGEGREKEWRRNVNVWFPLECPHLGTWPATQVCALTRNWTGNPLVCRLALNPLSHTSQGKKLFLKIIDYLKNQKDLKITHIQIQHMLPSTFICILNLFNICLLTVTWFQFYCTHNFLSGFLYFQYIIRMFYIAV